MNTSVENLYQLNYMLRVYTAMYEADEYGKLQKLANGINNWRRANDIPQFV